MLSFSALVVLEGVHCKIILYGEAKHYNYSAFC